MAPQRKGHSSQGHPEKKHVKSIASSSYLLICWYVICGVFVALTWSCHRRDHNTRRRGGGWLERIGKEDDTLPWAYTRKKIIAHLHDPQGCHRNTTLYPTSAF